MTAATAIVAIIMEEIKFKTHVAELVKAGAGVLMTGAPVGAEVSMIGANVSRTGAEVGAEVWIGANVVLDVLAVTGALVVLNKGRVGAVPKGEDVSLKATKEGSADGSPVG